MDGMHHKNKEPVIRAKDIEMYMYMCVCKKVHVHVHVRIQYLNDYVVVLM